ncbi:D-alanyl-D-alanine carboxypeptidase family protein [Arthrobacter russicus]|uniref:D-alanyl-D-alanine carboxypeptidase family protein n=1 Tax=Arthrobacter russicus TaxID=172040 RepID=UPI0031D55CC7
MSAVTCGLKDNGCYQTFQNGAINWTPNTGAKITKAGAIRSYWASQNYENGRFGYPVTDEICGQTAGGCYQDFQGGSILWSPTTGAQPSTPGAIRTTWAQTGYHGGPLGYPTNAETCNGEVCRQSFQNGIITWTRSAGTSVGYNSLVVNKRRPLNPIDYAPASTRNVSGVPMEAVAGSAANSLISAAAAEGVTVTTVSGYRDYWTQKGLYEDYVRRYGQQQADLISARPGFSEHQTGLALDIGDVTTGCGLQDCFENTAAGTWAKNNAWRFGFIIRYPKGFTSTTGYSYEPWHLRYVGTGISTDMRNHNVSTLEQYFGLPAAPDY